MVEHCVSRVIYQHPLMVVEQNNFMSFTYRNKKNGNVITRETPLKGDKKKDYILVSWIGNLMMKASKIIKK